MPFQTSDFLLLFPARALILESHHRYRQGHLEDIQCSIPIPRHLSFAVATMIESIESRRVL
jgi:hypothetical protein